jgi:drug/metabolite transporter (DMT)-like permease
MDRLAAALAVGAAALFAVGAVAQQQAAARNVDAGGLRLIGRLLMSPRWLAATFGNLLGYALQASALAAGSLLVVQPILVTTLVFALPLGARWNHRHITRREVLWAVGLCAALAVFLLASDPEGGHDVTAFRSWAPSVVVAGAVVVTAAIVATMSTGRRRSLAFAIVAGTCVGFASALTKSVVSHLGHDVVGALGHWEMYALVGAAAVGVFCQQLAFQAGSLEVSFPATMVLDPVVSVVVGIAALDERLQASGGMWGLIGAAVVVLVAGTIALARAGVPVADEDDPVSSRDRPSPVPGAASGRG